MLIFKISPLIGCVAFSNLIFNDCPFSKSGALITWKCKCGSDEFPEFPHCP